ncbi:MAG: DUF4412 domain-containing protein [Lentisphaerae bacterium]|nr:DUF4412 domain-containing protein [Lentisphaerota bacterium]
MKKIITLCLLISAFNFVTADVYIKSKQSVNEFEIMGHKQPAQNTTSEQWLTDTGMVVQQPNATIILNTKEQIFVYIDHESKTYIQTTLPLDIKKLFPAEIADLAEMMTSSITVLPLKETKKIGNWDCKLHEVTITMMMQQSKNRVWATTDLPFDWKKFADLQTQMFQLNTPFLDDNSLAELKKVQGIPILSELVTTVMGTEVKNSTEIVEIQEKKAPANLFDIPAGYTKKDRLSPGDFLSNR